MCLFGSLLLSVIPTHHMHKQGTQCTQHGCTLLHMLTGKAHRTRSTAWFCLQKVLTLSLLQCYQDNSDQERGTWGCVHVIISELEDVTIIPVSSFRSSSSRILEMAALESAHTHNASVWEERVGWPRDVSHTVHIPFCAHSMKTVPRGTFQSESQTNELYGWEGNWKMPGPL